MPERFTEWLATHDDAERPLIPAATVVVVRNAPGGIETLMMRRSSRLSFAEGMWVFPGGRIDADDHPVGGSDEAAAAITAAAREAKEEADLDIDPARLVHYAHWVPPREAPKRFSTWFFLAEAPTGAVTVDDGEILEHAWWRPADALERAHDRRIEILPPTWMTLHDLATFATVSDACAAVAERGPLSYATRIVATAEGAAAVWEPDAAYTTGDPELAGPRHRLVMTRTRWILERT